MENTPRKAAIYARTSLDMEGEGLGVQRQVAMCKKAAEEAGWTIVKELVEDPTSASDFTKKARPKYEELLEGLQSGLYDGVVVQRADRLSRRVRELSKVIDLGEQLGFSFLTVEGFIDLSTPTGRMAAQLGAVMAENETRVKSERHRWGNDQRRGMGRHYARKIPFGYLKGDKGMVKDPAVQEALEDAFKLVREGGSGRDVMRKFQKDGGPSYSGKPWSISTVFQILKNPTYAGILTHKGKEIGEGVDWEPYITREEFELMQASLKANSKREQGAVRRSPTREYLMSGLIWCSCEPEDGSRRYMTGHLRKDGALGYMCSGKRTGSCARTMVGDYVHGQVTNYVINTLNGLSPDRVLKPEVLTRRNEISASVAKIEVQQEEIRNDEGLELADRIAYSKQLKASKDALLSELAELTRTNLIGSLVAHVLDWTGPTVTFAEASKSSARVKEAFEGLELDQKRKLIDALGIYKHIPMGKGKRSELAIYPKDILTGEISTYSTVEDPDH